MSSRIRQQTMKSKLLEPVLTEGAIFIIENFGCAIVSDDFVGYTVGLPSRFKAIVLVSLRGEFNVYSTDIRHPMTPRRELKIYRYLEKLYFIREGKYDPFPEFEHFVNFKLRLEDVNFIDGPIFQTIQ